MGKDEQLALIERLRTRVHQLMLQDSKLQQQNATLKLSLEQSQQKEAELESKCKALSAQYANLKIAKAMELSEGDTRAAHRRFTNLIKQVDECLALLKS